MFNLERDGIDQGNLCDVHYWQTMHKACAESKQEEIKQLKESLNAHNLSFKCY